MEIIQKINENGLNIILLLLMGVIVFFILRGRNHQRQVTKLFNLSQRKWSKFRFNLKFTQKLKANIEKYYIFKPLEKKKKYADIIYISVLLVELILFIGLVIAKNYFLAILFPFMIHWFVNKVLKLLSANIHYYIQKNLPHAIKHLIKNMTKSNELKTIVLDTSNSLEEPLRSKFQDLSRKLVTENYEKSLMDFAKNLDDIWVYSFVFLLLSYKEQSKKADIIKNLTSLADMMDKENYNHEKRLTERKATVILNYCLGVIGVLALILNLIFNPYSIDFFFNSIGGKLVLAVGVFAILGTVIINILLTKKV